jgi:hypothetical protein
VKHFSTSCTSSFPSPTTTRSGRHLSTGATYGIIVGVSFGALFVILLMTGAILLNQRRVEKRQGAQRRGHRPEDPAKITSASSASTVPILSNTHIHTPPPSTTSTSFSRARAVIPVDRPTPTHSHHTPRRGRVTNDNDSGTILVGETGAQPAGEEFSLGGEPWRGTAPHPPGKDGWEVPLRCEAQPPVAAQVVAQHPHDGSTQMAPEVRNWDTPPPYHPS